MQPIESTYKAPDGVTLFRREWVPEQPRVAVVLIHGLGEHSGRYQHVADTMTAAGIAVFSMDLRGHGKTEGIRGYAPSYEAILKDIDALVAHAREVVPGKPVFLYGHSMGGSLGLYYGFTRPGKLNGYIITAPGLKTAKPVPPAKLFAANLLSKLAPRLTMNNDLELTGLSRDTTVVDIYKSDPLVHPLISARLGAELIGTGEWMLAHASEFKEPLLLMQGTGDRLVSPPATAEFASKVAGETLFKTYDGWYHELHNEPDKEQVIKVMVDWILEHSK